MRVLYVEDDDTLAMAVEHMLRQEGHECERASSGQEAIRLGRTNDYDVMLMDVMLPDLDGYEVVNRLHALGINIPFLIQSGLVERGNADDAAGFGVENYLVKPFNREELIMGLDRVVSHATGPGAARIDRRKEPRWNGTEPANVQFDYGKIVDCTIFSRSASGAAVEVGEDNLRWMTFFTLKTTDGSEFRCQQCWQFGNKVGAKFV